MPLPPVLPAENPHLANISTRLEHVLVMLRTHADHLYAMAERALGSNPPPVPTAGTNGEVTMAPSGMVQHLHQQLDSLETVVHDLGDIKERLLSLV